MTGNGAPDLAGLLDAYQQSWRERSGDVIRFGKRETIDSLGQLAERMLVTFQGSDFSKPTGRIIGIEEEFREELFHGYRDLLAPCRFDR